MIVCLVISEGSTTGPPMILAAYVGPNSPSLAQRHARTITGASVLAVEAMTSLPQEVIDDILSDDDDVDFGITPPINEVPDDLRDTPPDGLRVQVMRRRASARRQ